MFFVNKCQSEQPNELILYKIKMYNLLYKDISFFEIFQIFHADFFVYTQTIDPRCADTQLKFSCFQSFLIKWNKMKSNKNYVRQTCRQINCFVKRIYEFSIRFRSIQCISQKCCFLGLFEAYIAKMLFFRALGRSKRSTDFSCKKGQGRY